MLGGCCHRGRRAPTTADRDLTRSRSLSVTWLPAGVSRSACRDEQGAAVEQPRPASVPLAVFCGLDVGKSEHHACALDATGQRLYDKAPPNDEAALRAVFGRLAEHGRELVVVDQPTVAIATSGVVLWRYRPRTDHRARGASPLRTSQRHPRRLRRRY